MSLFRSILYISTGDSSEETAIMNAVSLAQNNQAELTIINVVPVITAGISLLHGSSTPSKLQAAVVEKSWERLETLIAPYKNKARINLQVLVGTIFLEAIKSILRNGHDLLIKPAENPSFIQRLFGSDDMQLLRNCPCPVWLLRTEEKPKYERILAAIDLDPYAPDNAEQGLNEHILGLAGSLALANFAELHVAHIWDAPAETMLRTWSENPQQASSSYVDGVRVNHEKAYEKTQQKFMQQFGKDTSEYLAPEFHLQKGVAATAIPQLAKKLSTDLVVMGTVARAGVSGLIIGNTAEAIFEQLQCSVLAIKPPGFVSPVKLS